MTIRSAARILAALAIVLFLWWPAEIYAEWKFAGAALLFAVFFLSLFHPAGDARPFSFSIVTVVSAAAMALVAVLSALAGADPYRSAEALLGYLAAASFGFAVARISDDAFAKRLEDVLLIVIAALTLYGLYQYLFAFPNRLVQPATWADLSDDEVIPALTRISAGRIFSRFALPSSFSCALLAAMPLVHRRLLSGARPIWLYASLLCGMTACLFVARSYAAVILFFGYWALDVWMRYPKIRKFVAAPAVILFLVIVLFLRPHSMLDYSDSANPIRLRLANWRVAAAEFFSAPVLGVGPGNFALLFSSHTSGVTSTRYTHSFPMTILAETGIAGAAAAGTLAFCFLLWLWRGPDEPDKHAGKNGTQETSAHMDFAPTAGLVLMILYAAVDIVFELPSLCFLFFFLLGISLPRNIGLPPPARWGGAALAIAGIFFAVILQTAHDRHASGQDMLRHTPPNRLALRAAGTEFESARAIWPMPAFDAAHGRANLMLARLDESRDRMEEARDDFARAVRKSPAAADYHAGLAESLLMMGDTRRAIAQFKEAARLDPRGAHVSQYLRLILEHQMSITDGNADVRSPF